MIIVLITQGKNESVDYLAIHLFKDDEKDKAEAFCKEVTDKDPERYWTFAEIIQEGETIEPARYKNWVNNLK